MIKNDNFKSEVSKNNPIIEKLTTKKEIKIIWNGEEKEHKEVYLGNQEDVMMVLDVLKLISENYNIYEYILNIVKKEGEKTAYDKLIKMRAIGDKIASFILRDILIINNMTAKDVPEVFPIDTWVEQIAEKIGCTGKLSKIKECLIKKCQTNNSNPLLFAAGLWYVGYNSLDILLDDFLLKQ